MPAWAWAALKWIGVVGAMLLVLVIVPPMLLDTLSDTITFGGEEDPFLEEGIEPSPTPEPEPEGGTQQATAMVGVRNAVVQTAVAETLTLSVEAAEELLVAFDPLPFDPACLIDIDLEINLLETTGATEIHVRPARVDDLAAFAQGDPLPADAAVSAGDPARALTTGPPGTLRWTVTGPYAIAAREAEPGADIVLAVFLPDDAEVAVTFATGLEDPDRLPRLRWTAVADCPGFDTDGPDGVDDTADGVDT
jgi:hypothetical protein